MRYELRLALRYLRSRRTERFVSLIAWSSGIGVAIGVAALIVVLSVMYGFDQELRNRILGFSSHVDVQGMGDVLQPWREWLKEIRTIPEVKDAAPYATSQAMLSSKGRATGVVLKGVDPNKEKFLASHVVGGRFLAMEGSPFELVIGKDLAKKLLVGPGDVVNVITPGNGVGPAGLMPRIRKFKVVGVFDSGFYEYDVGLALAPLPAVQRLNRMGEGVSGIELWLHDRERAARVAKKIREKLPSDAWVSDWMNRHRSFFRALRMERVVMGVILSLIVIVAVFNMLVSLVMAVMERRKEIAILKTVGATDAAVMRVFFYMGTLLVGVGTATGACLGLLLAWKLDAALAWFEKVTGVEILSSDVYYIHHVPSIVDPTSVIVVIGTSLFLGLAATFYPAWRAARVPPADALRYE